MVRILKSEKHVFWEALVIAVFIFLIGMLLGVFLENWRKGNIETLYFESEIQMFDLRVQSDIFSFQDLNCENAVKENVKFGDKIFEEALLLQDLEESQALTEALKTQHRRYDLLRTLFWVNSIKIKARCKNSFHTVVYLYNYDTSIDERSKQEAFSRFLGELKNKVKDKIVLIPIAADMGLVSTNNLIEQYNIDRSKFPVVIIDEKHKFYLNKIK